TPSSSMGVFYAAPAGMDASTPSRPAAESAAAAPVTQPGAAPAEERGNWVYDPVQERYAYRADRLPDPRNRYQGNNRVDYRPNTRRVPGE
ncbi:MAG TPA: hypothetical protein VFU47_02230, partial [Armatimonadota bacterium]|nr:hypothetical protein [Armatimonadota bacterium]